MDLADLKGLFRALYEDLKERGYFDEAIGYPYDLEYGDTPGRLGNDIPRAVYLATRKKGLWPLEDHIDQYSQADLFDFIEFAHDYISEPLPDGAQYRGFSGLCYTKFDRPAGQELYRTRVNELLVDFEEGFELNSHGEIITRAPSGFGELVRAQLPPQATGEVSERVQAAVDTFLLYRSSRGDRRAAIKELADVLESLRPKLKEVLTRKDESSIFEIANRFEIRHSNEKQLVNYDKDIWYRWIFYFYLATIHAATRLVDKGVSESVSRSKGS